MFMVEEQGQHEGKRSIVLTLKELSNNHLDRNGFNFLVETVYKIANSYIYHNLKRLPDFCKNGYNNKDHATDAISLLFIKNGTNKYPIISSFKNWIPTIDNEDEAMFYLYKITTNQVEQYITKCLKEADPIFAKILDSLNYFIKKHNYKKETILGQKFILMNDFHQTLEKPLISLEDLENVPSHHFMEINKVLDLLFEYFKSKQDFYLAIPLNALVTRIKNIQPFYNDLQNVYNTIETDIFIDEVVQQGYSNACKKLNSSYFQKDKLSKSETESYIITLHDLAKDLSNGGINSGLFNYLAKNMNNISKDEYKIKYHNSLEYLVKIMKKSIKTELEASYKF